MKPHLLVHDDGAQLAVVAHQDDLLGAQHQRHQRLRLRRLRALVHQQLRAPAPASLPASHLGHLNREAQQIMYA